VAYVGKTADALVIENDKLDEVQLLTFLAAAFSGAVKHLQPGGSFYIWHADSLGFTFRTACADVGLRIRQCLVWAKSTMVLGRQDYQWKHEPCLYGWKDGAAHTWLSDRSQTTVLEFDKPSRNAEHPTMKPLALFEYLIGNSCVKGGIVLDPFLGSGTSLIAAHRLGRTCYGCELDPRYADVILKRAESEGLSVERIDPPQQG
jgi:site-specific DNA-methyltransferase (adenine-specific)